MGPGCSGDDPPMLAEIGGCMGSGNWEASIGDLYGWYERNEEIDVEALRFDEKARQEDLPAMPKTLTILTPCYNEEANVRDLYLQVRAAVAAAGNYQYEHIFIDNASVDNTLAELKRLAAGDKNVKVVPEYAELRPYPLPDARL